MAKQRIAQIDGMSNGNGNHAHGVLIELVDAADASLLLNLQVTITGGADGKKRHASAKIDIDALQRAIDAARKVMAS